MPCSGRDVGAVEDDPPGRGVDEPQEQPADGRLAAARLAHQTEGLAASDLEVHAVHGAHLGHGALQDARPDGERLVEALEPHQGAGVRRRRRRGAAIPVSATIAARVMT